MDDAVQRFLTLEYGWTTPNVQTIHQGENDTFLVLTGGRAFVVRRYRSRHRSATEIAAELAWLRLLRGRLNVPAVVPTLNGDPFGTDGAHLFVVFVALPGYSIYQPTAADYERLGALQRELHEAADELGRQPDTWPGHARPVYDRETLIDSPRRALQNAPFLERRDKVQVEKIAEALAELYDEQLEASQPGFIHMDMHFGNVVVVGEKWFILDFDECGFGPRALDAGTVRFHAAFEGHLDARYEAFLSGYGGLPEGAVSLGSGLRAFYAAGKVPARLDIVGLAKNPVGVVQRYFEFIASELEALG